MLISNLDFLQIFSTFKRDLKEDRIIDLEKVRKGQHRKVSHKIVLKNKIFISYTSVEDFSNNSIFPIEKKGKIENALFSGYDHVLSPKINHS